MTDLRYATRQLLRTPGFTALAVLTLAVGIGLNTTLFALINSIVVRPMAHVRAEGLHWLASTATTGGFSMPLSYADFADYRDSSGVFASAAATGNAEFALAGEGEPVRLRGEIVSGNYFSLLDVPMAIGRGFAADEDRLGTPVPVAVISYRLWQERFAGAPRALGARMMLDGRPFTIVGVTPERFNGITHGPRRDVWVPMAAQPIAQPTSPRMLAERSAIWLSAVGTLAPSLTIEQANARLEVIAKRIAVLDTTKRGYSAAVLPVRGGMSPHDMNDVAPVALLASAATLLIFVICCSNVSNMLLARGVGRRREIAVRLSLGASRSRLVRQLLTESVLIAIAASALGVLLAFWANGVLASIIPASLDASPERNTILFSIAAAFVTALAFGVLPALHATRTNLVDGLKEATVGFDRRRSRLQRNFVVAQVSLSLVLLVVAGAFLGELVRASRADIGFDASPRVLAASFDLGLQGYTPEQASAFVTTLEQRVAGLPGVTDVSVTNSVPMGERAFSADVALDPRDAGGAAHFGENAGFEVYDDIVRPGFFRTVGLPMTRGRDFAAVDIAGSPYVAIVSEDFAERAWPGADPLGKRLSVTGSAGPFLTVVGVVRESALFGVGDRRRAIIFRAHLQFPRARDLALLVRSTGDAATLAPAIRAQLRALDPNVPLHALQTLAQYRRDRLAEPALGSSLLAIVGALALVLASVGVYAVIAFSVGQRTREIGVRVALGAANQQVTRLFLREGVRLTGVGVGIGLVLSAGVVKVLSSMFLGVSPLDVFLYAAIALLLTAVAAFASWIPARRAARVDPMIALRSE
jgi:putative ABC transport system permease protein